MAKADRNKIHRGMSILFAVVMVNALGVKLVEAKSSKLPENAYSVQRKGTVKTIKNHKSDDVIDCIDIYKQSAFDHPLLKNHTIQMTPTLYPKGAEVKKFEDKVLVEVDCPKGTIPIGRTQNHIGGQVQSMVSKKKQYDYNYDIKDTPEPNDGHEYALAILSGGNYFGAHAVINVWEPEVENNKEASFSQISVASQVGENLNAVQAGWMVNPQKGNGTRFFIYWTADSYGKTGCYNLECPGFVQVSKKYQLNAPIHPVSEYNSKQYDVDITIYQDQKSKNWWVRLQNEDLGYWPASIFTALGGGAHLINWGGQIINADSAHHTATEMGSGHFPSEGYGKASYFGALKYVNASGNQIDADGILKYVSYSSCYDLQIGENKHDAIGVNFYYGGPGCSM